MVPVQVLQALTNLSEHVPHRLFREVLKPLPAAHQRVVQVATVRVFQNYVPVRVVHMCVTNTARIAVSQRHGTNSVDLDSFQKWP